LVHNGYHAEREVTTAAGAIGGGSPGVFSLHQWRKQNVPIASMALSVHVDLECPLVGKSRTRYAKIDRPPRGR